MMLKNFANTDYNMIVYNFGQIMDNHISFELRYLSKDYIDKFDILSIDMYVKGISFFRNKYLNSYLGKIKML